MTKPARVVILGGKAKAGPPSAAMAFAKELAKVGVDDNAAKLRGLGLLARQIYLNRNLQGWEKQKSRAEERLTIKTEVRPHLMRSIRWARVARDTLLAGDVKAFELLRDRARMYHAFALVEMYQPYANRFGVNAAGTAKISNSGGVATADEYAQPELDSLIRGCFHRGESTRRYVKEWSAAYNLSRQTIYNRINRIKEHG